ncbi:MAG: carbon storage regulator [Phycisphaerales bacterium]|nr:MAG: carbon storage regulator [Phycisphaerales bacterium]
MLVLSRLRDETIMIGDDIEITVVDIRGDKVRLGITAPSRIAVHRKEVYDAIKSENERAAKLEGKELNALRPRTGRASGGGGDTVVSRLAAGTGNSRKQAESAPNDDATGTHGSRAARTA